MLTALERRALLSNLGASALALPETEWRALDELLRPRRLKKGEYFVKPGDKACEFAVVRSGLLRFFYIGPEGNDSTKAFRGAGELAAAFAELLTGAPARAHIQALEDSELLAADYDGFKRLYGRHPCWQEVGRLIAEHFYVAKERREYELLQLSARERYLLFDKEYPGLAKRIPQYHVASYLGITPVALSRIVSGLKRR